MRYRFILQHRQFKVGDLVPESWDSGIVTTMLRCRRIESVEEEKEMKAPPADKMLRRKQVLSKAVEA